MTQSTRVALIPRDGFICKDGRSWGTEGAGRGHSLEWPWPSTILGALRSAWGRAVEERSGRRFSSSDWLSETASMSLHGTLVLRRPLNVCSRWQSSHRLWPVPADATWLENATEPEENSSNVNRDRKEIERSRLVMLNPVPARTPTLGRDDDDIRESLWRPDFSGLAKPVEGKSRWWDDAFFTSWLAGTVPPGKPSVNNTSSRVQVHVGIRSDTMTAEEGILYSHDVVETLEHDAEWAIGAELTVPSGSLPRTVLIGSDGRTALVEDLRGDVFAAPGTLLDAFDRGSPGLRLVVVTPSCFERGWLPDGFSAGNGVYSGCLPGVDGEVVLRASFVQRPVFISGWDMAAGAAKPTSSMVAPGAVYFFERVDGRPFSRQEAESMWLAAMGGRTDEGFGRVVPGTWKTRSSI